MRDRVAEGAKLCDPGFQGVVRTGVFGQGGFCSRPDVQGVKTADAAAAGMVELSGAKYQKVQFLTVEEILDGRKPRLPFPEMPDVFKKADVAAPKGLEV